MELLNNNPSMQDLIEKLNEVVGSLNNSLPNTDSEIAEVKKLVSFGSGVLAGRLNAKLWYFKTQELMTASTELCEGDSCFVLKDGVTTGEGTFEYWYIYKTSDVADIVDSYVDLSNPDLVAVKLQDMTLKDVKNTLSAQISDQSKDLNAKISNLRTDTETALSGKADLVGGLVPSSQLPSYVDDVIESWLKDEEFPKNAYAKEDTEMTTPITPEGSKIYVNLLNNKTYRWGGNFYVEVSKSLAIGETSTTAFAGDKGKNLEEKVKNYPIDFHTILSNNTLLENPIPILRAQLPKVDDSQNSWAQQGMIVTSKYIVLAQISSNTKNRIVVLDKNTFELANIGKDNPFIIEFSSSTTPNSSHANCMTWDEDKNEVYLITIVNKYAIVFDADTFLEKRREQLPYGGHAACYDNINKQWCFSTQTNSEFIIYICDSNKKLLRTLTLDRVSTTQGCLFHNGIIFLPLSELGNGDTNYQKRYNTNFAGYQNILVLDSYGKILKSWWFPKEFEEFEDIGILNTGKLLIAVNSPKINKCYELAYKAINDTENLTKFDSRIPNTESGFLKIFVDCDLNSFNFGNGTVTNPFTNLYRAIEYILRIQSSYKAIPGIILYVHGTCTLDSWLTIANIKTLFFYGWDGTTSENIGKYCTINGNSLAKYGFRLYNISTLRITGVIFNDCIGKHENGVYLSMYMEDVHHIQLRNLEFHLTSQFLKNLPEDYNSCSAYPIFARKAIQIYVETSFLADGYKSPLRFDYSSLFVFNLSKSQFSHINSSYDLIVSPGTKVLSSVTEELQQYRITTTLTSNSSFNGYYFYPLSITFTEIIKDTLMSKNLNLKDYCPFSSFHSVTIICTPATSDPSQVSVSCKQEDLYNATIYLKRTTNSEQTTVNVLLVYRY